MAKRKRRSKAKGKKAKASAKPKPKAKATKVATTLNKTARKAALRAGLEVKECGKCGSEFVPDKLHPYQKFGPCCKKSQAKAEPEERPCEFCDKDFTPDVAHPYQRFCTPLCARSDAGERKRLAAEA